MDKMNSLRLEIGSKLVEIEDLLEEWGLDSVTGITLVARDPDEPKGLHVVLTNGGDDEIRGAIEILNMSLSDNKIVSPANQMERE